MQSIDNRMVTTFIGADALFRSIEAARTASPNPRIAESLPPTERRAVVVREEAWLIHETRSGEHDRRCSDQRRGDRSLDDSGLGLTVGV